MRWRIKNLDSFLIALKKSSNRFINNLRQLKTKGYYVFHDAYGYFEQEFELRPFRSLYCEGLNVNPGEELDSD